MAPPGTEIKVQVDFRGISRAELEEFEQWIQEQKAWARDESDFMKEVVYALVCALLKRGTGCSGERA